MWSEAGRCVLAATHRSALDGSRASAEGIARPRVASLEALSEPAHALLRRAVREGIAVHAATALREDTIVAHRRSRVEAFLEVALVELVALLRRAPPDSGVAVGLQLEAHRVLIGRRRISLLCAPHLLIGAEQVLHVMPE